MSITVTVSYQLNPPTDIQAENLSTSKTQSFPVKCGSDNSTEYYGALHKTIEEAKDQLGNELTAWRDAVGKAELSKETPKTLKYDADEEEEDE
jgi:streptomycin 6-kinase